MGCIYGVRASRKIINCGVLLLLVHLVSLMGPTNATDFLLKVKLKIRCS
jgi:hypothetical protein